MIDIHPEQPKLSGRWIQKGFLALAKPLLWRIAVLFNFCLGVAEYKYDKRLFRSLKPVVGAIHELPLPQVSYLNSATPLVHRSWHEVFNRSDSVAN